MTLAFDALLPVKAHMVGAASASSPHRNGALSMLSCAIEEFDHRSDEESKLRLAFYLAARADLQRGTPEALTNRASVREISRDISSSFFLSFMKVEEATTALSRQQWSIDQMPVSTVGSVMTAVAAFGYSYEELSDKERRFLEHVSLRQLLEKHGAPYAF